MTPLADRDWDLLRAGPATAVHERAYKQLLADLPADEAGQAEFVAAWDGVDGYLARMIADGIFTAIEIVAAGPDGTRRERPRQVAGAEITELDQDLLVRPSGSETACQLNNTAAVIWDLCDGHRTVPEIAGALAGAFGLDHHPLAEVAAAITEFSHAGILTEPAAYPTAESRSP